MTHGSVLTADAVSVDYPITPDWPWQRAGRLRAVHEASLSLTAGETLGLVGESNGRDSTSGLSSARSSRGVTPPRRNGKQQATMRLSAPAVPPCSVPLPRPRPACRLRRDALGPSQVPLNRRLHHRGSSGIGGLLRRPPIDCCVFPVFPRTPGRPRRSPGTCRRRRTPGRARRRGRRGWFGG